MKFRGFRQFSLKFYIAFPIKTTDWDNTQTLNYLFIDLCLAQWSLSTGCGAAVSSFSEPQLP